MTFPKSSARLRRASRLAAWRRGRRRLVSLLAVGISAAALAGGVLGSSLATPEVALAAGPLPACRYDDILTAPRDYDDWATTLVDTILRVPKGYIPPDLVSVNEAGIGGSGQVRAVAIPDLMTMTAAAKANGTPIAVQSAYRSYTTQIATFQYWVNLSGYKQALLYSARPGHSEHQLGLAIDFKSAAGGPPWSGSDWGTSPAGSWMNAHAWEYGFIQSYPKGKVRKTCYDYESWHFRYVGVAEAAAIHASGLTLREYLWAHFTTAVVPAAAGSPPPTKSPTAAPTVQPSVGPSDVPSDAPAPGTSSPTAGPLAPGDPTAQATAPPPSIATPPPTSPAGASSNVDSVGWIAAAGLVVVLIALVGTVSMSRRRRDHRSGGQRGP